MTWLGRSNPSDYSIFSNIQVSSHYRDSNSPQRPLGDQCSANGNNLPHISSQGYTYLCLKTNHYKCMNKTIPCMLDKESPFHYQYGGEYTYFLKQQYFGDLR